MELAQSRSLLGARPRVRGWPGHTCDRMASLAWRGSAEGGTRSRRSIRVSSDFGRCRDSCPMHAPPIWFGVATRNRRGITPSSSDVEIAGTGARQARPAGPQDRAPPLRGRRRNQGGLDKVHPAVQRSRQGPPSGAAVSTGSTSEGGSRQARPPVAAAQPAARTSSTVARKFSGARPPRPRKMPSGRCAASLAASAMPLNVPTTALPP